MVTGGKATEPPAWHRREKSAPLWISGGLQSAKALKPSRVWEGRGAPIRPWLVKECCSRGRRGAEIQERKLGGSDPPLAAENWKDNRRMLLAVR